MSGNRGRTERPQLDDLVHRARAELRDWTEHTDNDPGVALLELFAYVGELLSSYADRVVEEAHLDSGRHRTSRRRATADATGEVEVEVEVGDGENGRRPPSGGSIGVRYRQKASDGPCDPPD